MTGQATPGASPGPVQVVAVFGPTGLGKTEVAVALAELLGAETVAADSMQVYHGLPILTNQPDAGQLERGRYHLVGTVDPSTEWSVAAYAEVAHAALDEIGARGRPAIVEGGSGLYLRAALGGLTFPGRPDPTLRHELETAWARDAGAVIEELRRLDPATVVRLDLGNPRRVIRALEAVRTLGRPLAEAERGSLWSPAGRYTHCLVALEPRRETLRARIDARVDAMIAAGALDEVRRVRAAGPLSRTVSQAIGVRELGAVLDGELALDEAVSRMRSRTHALVRRQLTWQRKLPDALVEPVDERDPHDVAASIVARLRTG